jgi:hypothetical protein
MDMASPVRGEVIRKHLHYTHLTPPTLDVVHATITALMADL